MQGTTIILGAYISETNVHSTIFDGIKQIRKLLYIYRLKSKNLPFI